MDVDISIVADTTAAATGVIYSTKNRCELSAQTAFAALSESDCDGFWLDGSDTTEGREFPFTVADRLPALREIHRGVDGGPDRAIIYGLSYLLARGYQYLALVENDVLLTPEWLPAAMSAMQRASADGLRVGAATVRTFDRRIMFVRPGYAVMFNIGAGMIVLTREAAQAVLTTYRSTNGREISRVFRKMTQGEIGPICERSLTEEHWYSADWFFDCALMQLGFASVGALPALARNIEVDSARFGIRPVSEAQPAAGLDPGLFRIYHRNLWWAAQTEDSVGYFFDPQLDRFIVFPHQLPSRAYSGEWKTKWQQCFGPFEVRPTNTGDALRWQLVNGSCDVAFRTTDENKHCRIAAGGSTIDHALPGAAHIAVQICSVAGGGSLPIEVQPDPGVAISGIMFTDPQPWFRGLANWRDRMERLGIIKHLPIAAEAPSVVGDVDDSLPHLIGHER